MARLCALCATISFLELPPVSEWLYDFHFYEYNDKYFVFDKKPRTVSSNSSAERLYGSPGIPHQPSLEALQNAATACDVCSWIAKFTLEVPVTRTDQWGILPRYEFFLTGRRRQHHDQGDGIVVWSRTEDPQHLALMGAIGYCVDDESTLRNLFRGRPVLEDPTEAVNFDRLRSWLRNCTSNHESCQNDTYELPRRVLDVARSGGPMDQVKLTEPAVGTKDKYAVLSHCWGGSRQALTTRDSIATMKAGIDVSSLPQTFRDAIMVSRELGIQYLWIDSLCICQDDPADWERESAKMAQVYAHACFSIAATRSQSDTTGFLTPRAKRKHVALHTTVAFDKNGKKEALEGDIILFDMDVRHVVDRWKYVEQHDEPLSKRAWAFQERNLSQRTFHFGTSQTSFECKMYFETEDGFRTPRVLFNVSKNEALEKIISSSSFRNSWRWEDIVEHYSHLQLSKDTDKLPALSGMARLFHEWRGDDEYVAGNWKKNLVQALCFRVRKGVATRPKRWRAPSWSWASIDGHLGFFRLGDAEDAEVLVIVKNVQVKIKGENAYGELEAGTLELDGFLEKLWVSADPEHIDPKVRIFNTEIGNGNQCNLSAWPDLALEVSRDVRQQVLYALPLAVDTNAVALWVTPDKDTPGAFRREGLVHTQDPLLREKWKERKRNGELETITLV